MNHFSQSSSAPAVEIGPATSAAMLVQWAASRHVSIRGRVAAHRNTPAETLSALSRDEAPFVRWQVAKNLHTPLPDLLALRDDESEAVRRAAQSTSTVVQKVTAA